MEITQCLPQIFSLKTLVIVFIFLSHFSADGKLEIRRIKSPIEAFQGQNMTLPCLFYGYKASPLDLSLVSVKWILRTSEEEKLVYWYNGSHHIQNRSGSHIPHSGLRGGNGSLYIPNIQFSDEGEYTCTVFVTPEKEISKVSMEVSAKPTCTLSDSRLEMTPDTERSLTCYVNGFYPKLVTINWVKYSKASSNKSELDIQTWISLPVQNHDGTYNVTSLLTVRPMSTDEDGDVYSCVIRHRSQKDALTLNVTLSVQPIEGDNTYKWRTATGITVGIIAVILLILILCYFCVKEPPDVSEISNNDLIHMEESILKCYISGFRPKKLKLKLYLTNDKEKRLITSWSSRKPRERSQKNDSEQAMVSLQPKNEPTDPILECDISSNKWFLFRCVCSIRITPDFNKHNGEQLFLEVHHKALKSPRCRMQVLKVNTPPKIDPIQTNKKSYNIGDQLELTCKIHSFYLEIIQVLWYKDTEEMSPNEVHHSNVQKNVNGLYYVTSCVKLTVTKEDFEKTFRCKAKQQCYITVSDSWKLRRMQTEPVLDPILANQESYRVGDQLELKCRIHSFYPLNINVTWCKENEVIPSKFTEPEEDEETKLLYVISRMSYTVTKEDFGKTFTCKVAHRCKHDSVQWKLEKQKGIQESK